MKVNDKMATGTLFFLLAQFIVKFFELRHGYGVFYYANGSMYEGEWE